VRKETLCENFSSHERIRIFNGMILNLIQSGKSWTVDPPVIPQATIELAKRFEGFHKVPKNDPQGHAYPYICPAGFWTIGYGHLCDEDHPPITKGEGEVYLTQDLQTALNSTLRHCPVLAAEPEGRLAAIVDFTFNLGAGRLQTSTLRRRVNQRDWSAAARELRRWVHGGGRVLPGLVTRREAEVLMLL
jgi:lysozyme